MTTTTPISLPALGLDIAKAKFDAVLLQGDTLTHQIFANTSAGFDELRTWLVAQNVTQAQVCLEATNTYGVAVATTLHEAGHRVSIINPARLKAYAQVTMTRTKTDKTDAGLLARFCRQEALPQWQPAPVALATLRALARRLEALQRLRHQEANRLDSLTEPLVRVSIERLLAYFDTEIAQIETQLQAHLEEHAALQHQVALLDSIPGIGPATAVQLLAEIQDWEAYTSARELTAQAGLTPKQKQSGSSVHGQPRLSKLGSARLRKILYFPAIVATRWNPLIQALAERLTVKGKPKMVIIGAAMRKLLVLAFGVLKSGVPFDPDYRPGTAKPILAA